MGRGALAKNRPRSRPPVRHDEGRASLLEKELDRQSRGSPVRRPDLAVSSLAAKQGDEHHHGATRRTSGHARGRHPRRHPRRGRARPSRRRLGATEIPTTRAGFQQLLAWASQLGVIDRVGIQGTGSYGAGLFRWLRARGITVIEVDRPDRKLRRQRGKDDITDAEGAARSVISGQATGIPKSRTATWR
jgi:hypothetical protein